MAKQNQVTKSVTAIEAIESEIAATNLHFESALSALNVRLEKAREAEEQRNAVALINQAKAEAFEALERAQKLALKYNLSFEFSLEYGMGGTFNDKVWGTDAHSGRWESSSSNC